MRKIIFFNYTSVHMTGIARIVNFHVIMNGHVQSNVSMKEKRNSSSHTLEMGVKWYLGL